GGLCYLSLLEFFGSTPEHSFGNIKSQNIVCLLEKFLRLCEIFIKILAHSGKLGALSGKNICFHRIKFLKGIKYKDLFAQPGFIGKRICMSFIFWVFLARN